MVIRTQSADGITHEFPDETPPEAVDKAMKAYAEEHRDKTSTLEQVGRGMEDPFLGAGQIAARVVPQGPPAKAEKLGHRVYTPPGAEEIDKFVREREQAIQKERGGSQNIDWSRMLGQAISPANLVGAGIGGAIGERLIGPIANRLLNPTLALVPKATTAGVVGGGVAGALSPEADPREFAKRKMAEFGLGGMLGGVIGGTGGALASGLSGWGSYIARNHPDNLTSDAVVKILKRFKQDAKVGGPSAADALDLVEAANKPLSLIDVSPAGGNVEGLAGHVARQPGESRAVAQAFLTKRDAQAGARLEQDVGKYISSGPTAFEATQAMLEGRTAASRPIYQQVNELQNVWSPRLQQFFDHPEVRKGLAAGYQLESMESLAEGRPITASQMGIDIGIDGSIKILDVPNMRLLNMAKKGMDAGVSAERDPITGRLSERGVALDKLRRAYVEAIDAADSSGLYKKARQTWGGYSASMDAVKLGKAVFNAHPEELTAELKQMSPSEREFFRVGVADIMREKLLKAGFSGDESKQLIKNAWTERVLRPVFENRADYDHFVEAVTSEREMFARGVRMVGGSQTAGRVAEDTSNEHLLTMGKMAAQAAAGNILGMVKNAWSFYKDIGLKPNPELNARIAQILFTTKVPSDVAKMLRSGIIPPRINPRAALAKEVAGGSVPAGTAAGAAAGETMDREQSSEEANP